MNYIKSIFDETGFSNIWDGQNILTLNFLMKGGGLAL
jgi:hypothetical protein